jgi:hypothetical protein
VEKSRLKILKRNLDEIIKELNSLKFIKRAWYTIDEKDKINLEIDYEDYSKYSTIINKLREELFTANNPSDTLVTDEVTNHKWQNILRVIQRFKKYKRAD